MSTGDIIGSTEPTKPAGDSLGARLYRKEPEPTKPEPGASLAERLYPEHPAAREYAEDRVKAGDFDRRSVAGVTRELGRELRALGLAGEDARALLRDIQRRDPVSDKEAAQFKKRAWEVLDREFGDNRAALAKADAFLHEKAPKIAELMKGSRAVGNIDVLLALAHASRRAR